MSKISVLTGEVINGLPYDYIRINNETFKAIKVMFLEADIDVVISEHLAKEEYSGKINVTGYLASYVSKGDKPQFFFFANNIEDADEDAPLTNKVTFYSRVTKVSSFKTSSRGLDILPLVLADYNPHKMTSVLYACLRGKHAREYKDKEKGYYISGEGYLKRYRDIYEIIVTDIFEEE